MVKNINICLNRKFTHLPRNGKKIKIEFHFKALIYANWYAKTSRSKHERTDSVSIHFASNFRYFVFS